MTHCSHTDNPRNIQKPQMFYFLLQIAHQQALTEAFRFGISDLSVAVRACCPCTFRPCQWTCLFGTRGEVRGGGVVVSQTT